MIIFFNPDNTIASSTHSSVLCLHHISHNTVRVCLGSDQVFDKHLLEPRFDRNIVYILSYRNLYVNVLSEHNPGI